MGFSTLDDAKAELLEQFARIGKVVSSPARLRLLDLLAQGEKTVEQLARQAGLTIPNTSNHLQELRSAALVTTRKEGTYVHYSLAAPVVHEFLRSLQNLARHRLAEVREIVDDYFRSRDRLEPVPAAELLQRLRSDDVVLLDVRPDDEFLSGHIPGALSIPVDELEDRLSELPVDREIIAYCRGPYCVFAIEALAVLRAAGFSARRLEDGVPDWKARGGALATGDGRPEASKGDR